MADGGAVAAASSELAGGDVEVTHKPCYTCQVRFPSFDVLTAHFASQWHQYNVKRAAAELAPVSLALFQRRKAEALAKRAAEEEAARPRKFKCTLTGKVFNSVGRLATHYASKKIKAVIKAKVQSGELSEDPLAGVDLAHLSQDQLPHIVTTIFLDEATAGAGSSEPPAAEKRFLQVAEESSIHDICFMDLHPVASLQENLARLVEEHEFIIPDIPYLSDLPGLLGYCHDKVLKGQTCLYCNTGFASLQATLQHMADKGHKKLPFDTEGRAGMVEYEQFWDFDKDVVHLNSKGERVVPMTHGDREFDEFGNMVLRDGGSLGHKQYAKYYVQDLHKGEDSTAVSAVLAEGTTRFVKHHFGRDVADAMVLAGTGSASRQVSTFVDGALFKAKTRVEKNKERHRSLAQRAAAADATAVQTNKTRNKNKTFVQQYMGAG